MPHFINGGYKDWLYRQGTWELVESLDDPTWEKAYDDKEKQVVTHGIFPQYGMLIYSRSSSIRDDEQIGYPYYVEVNIQDYTHSFYIGPICAKLSPSAKWLLIQPRKLFCDEFLPFILTFARFV